MDECQIYCQVNERATNAKVVESEQLVDFW
jgi:hypothetical protein